MADYNYGGGYAYQDEGTGTADDVYYAYADDYANQEENSGEHAGTLNKAFNTAANKAFNTAASDESWGCCNDAQTNFLLLYFAYCLVAFIVWKTLVATPIETMNRVLHKVNQAFVTWLTGGDLVDDEDEDEEASNNYHASKPHVTGTPVRGESDRRAPLVVGTPLRIKDAINRGCGCLVIPAGYIGTSFWAFFLVVMAGGRQTATSTAGILTAILLVTLYRVPEPNVAAVTMAHVATIALITYIEWFWYSPLLQYLILFYGVCTFVFVLTGISADSNPRKPKEVRASDSYKYWEASWRCCLPKFVASHWIFWAIVLQSIAIWIAMAEMSDECKGSGWLGCAVSSKGAVDAWDGLDFDGFWQQGFFSNVKNTTVSWKDSYFDSAGQ